MFDCSFAAFLGWHGLWGMITVAMVIAVTVYLFVTRGNAKRRRADSDDSLSLLKRRLAAGEITVGEFNTLKQYL